MKIEINGLNWEIDEVETENRKLYIDGVKCYGVCLFNEQEIVIDGTLKRDKIYQVLKHELTHAFVYCYLLERKKNYNEEDLCEFVSLYADEIVKLAKEYMLEGLK